LKALLLAGEGDEEDAAARAESRERGGQLNDGGRAAGVVVRAVENLVRPLGLFADADVVVVRADNHVGVLQHGI
jgi:hypothetical protein